MKKTSQERSNRVKISECGLEIAGWGLEEVLFEESWEHISVDVQVPEELFLGREVSKCKFPEAGKCLAIQEIGRVGPIISEWSYKREIADQGLG